MKTLIMAKFLKILKVELEDLQGHLDLLESDYQSMLAERRTTEHVARENAAVFENEKRCLSHFAEIVGQTDMNAFVGLDALVDHLKRRFVAEVESCGYARAAYVFAERKMQKVARYVSS
jgi:hypothetical protein